MVVCHCWAVNEQAIRAATADPAVTVDDIASLCGAGSSCGGCRETIQWLLDRCHAERGQPVSLALAG